VRNPPQAAFTLSKGRVNSDMKSNKSSKSNSRNESPQHNFTHDVCMDPHAEFETELNRNLGNMLNEFEIFIALRNFFHVKI